MNQGKKKESPVNRFIVKEEETSHTFDAFYLRISSMIYFQRKVGSVVLQSIGSYQKISVILTVDLSLFVL